MKTKFLRYSLSKLNQVVWHRAELEKVGEGVYTYLKMKDPYREEGDVIAIVLQLDNVFFEYEKYTRRFLANHDVVATGAQFRADFHRTIEQIMQQGRHMQLLFIRIYQELGLDAEPLIRYRKERQLRKQREDKEKQRLKKQEEQRKQQQAREREQERLKTVGEEFIAGQFISCADFISLCKRHDIPIPLHTHGTLKNRVELLSLSQLRISRMRGQRSPKLKGCFLLVETLRTKLTAK